MTLFSLDDLAIAATAVRALVPPTPAYAWPLLARRTGVNVIVKHENHTLTGSFKARGGLSYVDALQRSNMLPKGLITATRGNHGQSIAIGAKRAGIPAAIVVPEGNSAEKNAAMEAFGGELTIAGRDFDESRAIARHLQLKKDLHFVPSFHRDLVVGVATYGRELFADHSCLDAVYVPIGMGSGICGLITVRDLLGLKTEIIGVVSDQAPAFALSFEAGRPISTETAHTFADGLACREPQAEPLEIIRKGASRLVRVTDDEIAAAMRLLYVDTHNIAEGAGAAALAALIKERLSFQGRRVAVILTGGNIDMPVFARVLQGETPKVRPR
ncbi:threonine dehydratase [Rhizobium leguminosarum]|uniref:threonine dehydratase n=1 Tax=Rhizobium leguminosarum TaxID=384 RepID=UPI001442A306|nr:threonine dehydratase [Rhizobium leguminosarum]MBY5868664.1 threonine dehydratase [Rhizobium leguminosarum]NKM08739.1 threonine dehydratase [Rhizobium leguminosarum bv. viciae]